MALRPTMLKIAMLHNFEDTKVMRRAYWHYTKMFQSENLLFLLAVWDYSRDTGYGKKIEGIYNVFFSDQSYSQVNLAYATMQRSKHLFGGLSGGGARINTAGELLLEECASTINKLLEMNDSQNKSKVRENYRFYMNPGQEQVRTKANWMERNLLRREPIYMRTRAARASVQGSYKEVLDELEGYFGYRPWLKELQTLG